MKNELVTKIHTNSRRQIVLKDYFYVSFICETRVFRCVQHIRVYMHYDCVFLSALHSICAFIYTTTVFTHRALVYHNFVFICEL